MLARELYLVRLGVATLMLTACGGHQSLAPLDSRGQAPRTTAQPAVTSAPSTRPGHHQVQAGETLYSIAWKYGYDFKQVALWNNIEQPYRIYKGQWLLVAVPSALASPRLSPDYAVQPAPGVPAQTRDNTVAVVPDSSDEIYATDSAIAWQWPAQGPLIERFSAGNKGLSITGKESQPIRAAAAGRVVYRGNGLVGLGELVIVKHNKSFLSAYAHNKKILVNEGEQVALGQPIAEMGRSGAERVMLYFEIRKDGKPVDPAHYLPKLRL